MGPDGSGVPTAPPPSPVRRCQRAGSWPAPPAAAPAPPCLRPGSLGSWPLPRPETPAPPPPPPPPTTEAVDGAAGQEALEEHRRRLEACIREASAAASAAASEWGCRLEGLVVNLAAALEAGDPRCDPVADAGEGERPEAAGAPRYFGDEAAGAPRFFGGDCDSELGDCERRLSLERRSSEATLADGTGSGILKGALQRQIGSERSADGSHEIRQFSKGLSFLSDRVLKDGHTIMNCVHRLETKLHSQPQPAAGLLGRIATSKAFEVISAIIIMMNAVYIAYVSDLDIKTIGQEEDASLVGALFGLDLAFTVWYAAELVMRVAVYRWTFFLSKDWGWNAFDTFLVLSSLQDLLLSVGSNLGVLRVMRLARMLKLLRLIRLMRTFRELRLILNAILSCMKSMFWAMLLILGVSFMFGLCFLHAAADYLREHGDRVDESQKEELMQNWGGVQSSMYTLYAVALGGVEWDAQAQSLRPVGYLFFLLFLLYIGFFFCVITNTLTSLFVEATMVNAEKDQQQMIQAELEQKEVYVDHLKNLFVKIGGQHTAEVTLEDFMAHIEEPEMLVFATTLGIDMIDLKQFFSVLSSGGKQLVDLERFVVGCIRLKGAAKSMDLMDMKITLEESTADVRESLRLLEGKIDAVASVVETNASRRRRAGGDRAQRPRAPPGPGPTSAA